MSFNIKVHVDSIMQSMRESGYYCEMSEKQLYDTLEKHLIQEYNKRISVISLKLDLEKSMMSDGEEIDNDFYREEIAETKAYILRISRELARSKS